MNFKTTHNKMHDLSFRGLLLFLCGHNTLELIALSWFTSLQPPQALFILPWFSLAVCISILLSKKLFPAIYDRYKLYMIFGVLASMLVYRTLVVDDNIIGTPTNLSLLPVLVGFGLFHSKKLGFGLLLVLLLWNALHASAVFNGFLTPWVLAYPPLLELYFLTASFGMIVLISSLNEHYSSHIDRVLRFREATLNRDLKIISYLNNANQYAFKSFRHNIDVQSRKVQDLCKQLAKHIESSDKIYTTLATSEKLLLIIDKILRNIELRAHDWVDQAKSPPLNKQQIRQKTFQDASLDRRLLIYIGLLLGLGIVFYLNQVSLHHFAIAQAILSVFFIGLGFLVSYYPRLSIYTGISIFTLYLLFMHTQFSSYSGTAPIMQMTELLFSIFLIYRFGWKRIFFVPVLFVVFAILQFYLVRYGLSSATILHDPPLPALVLFYFLIGLSLLILSRFFKKRQEEYAEMMRQQNKERRNRRDELWIVKTQRKEQLTRIYELSDRNSHRLRAPVARIMSLLELQKEGVPAEMIELQLGQSVIKVILKALEELQSEIHHMQQHFEHIQAHAPEELFVE
jgi:hypothetical protein